jgi:hypothetical protein
MDELERRVRSDIDQYGWHVAKIMGDDRAPGWAYTIGLLETAGHAELSVFGLDLEEAHEVLNHLGNLARAGRTLAPGEHEGIFHGLPCGIRQVDPRWLDVFFGNAAWHYKSDRVAMLQCFWPDAEGRFPWEPEFAASWKDDQPLLFHPEVESALTPHVAEVLRLEGAL